MGQADEELLVDADWLLRNLGRREIVPIDTRPADEFWAGHLEGARHFDPFPFHYYDTGERGLKEFLGQLEWIFSALGITGAETVVFYENDAGMRAARGAWMLEYAGHPAARMLDGGLKALSAQKLSKDPSPITPTAFKAKPRSETLASFSQVLEHLGRPEVQIFDVRSDAEYFSENIRARRGGAIPGAIHLDWTASLDSSGAFKSPAALSAQFKNLGLSPEREVVTYCQGGYRAAHAYIALKRAGFKRVRNYLASWAEWGNRDDLPIEKPRRRA